ncbi:tetratricopeptide repeat protein [Sphingomonas donggukensis]|uniref:Tetratricopeptide repeat protein n=1 Tax=Sphingomonas donggukensis TaxID=2949093 RepID=A0ABY4TW95_9SPHN|nr:tetratricopeptide repeat protein [Sphingomonas donggukensis]URW76661.1 tetratricopeptide repeat protein [Sphingomonas donggukensis]
MAGMRMVFGLAAAAVAFVSPAMAQAQAIKVAHDAILAGDFHTAERTLDAERRIFPKRAEVLLNLAAIYAGTGRWQDAARLYRIVLELPDSLMDLSSDRTARAHAIAHAGLLRLRYVQTAAR